MFFFFQSGAVDKDAYQRHLVKTTPKVSDILRESGLFGKDTKYRNFVAGDVLGYITPVIILIN